MDPTRRSHGGPTAISRPARTIAGGAGLLLMLPALGLGQQPSRTDTTRTPPVVGQLEEITVTAAPARRTLAASTVSLSAAALQRAPAFSPYDRLRLAAGLEVHDQGQGPGFASNASLRGFSSDHSTDLALWIDGVPVNEPVNGHAEGYSDWSVVFPQAIRSIEIFKGPTNPVYGNFALAGAVSVRTLERMRGTEAELAAGGFGRVEGSILTGWDRGRSGGVIGLRGLREGGWRPNSTYELGQAHVRAVQDLSSLAALDLGLELYASGWDSPGYLPADEFDEGHLDHVANATDGGFKRRAQQRVSLRVLGSSLLWRSTVYATQGRWQLFLTTPPLGGHHEGSGSQVEEEDRRYGLGATSALTWIGSRGRVTVGVEGRWDHTDYENWFTTNRSRDSAQVLVRAAQGSGALFVEASGSLGDVVSLHLGGRLDARRARSTPAAEPSTSHTRGIVSPKAGLTVRLPRLFDLYGSVSRGFRQTDGIITDPDLPFISAWAYEAGAKLDRERLSFSVAAFHLDVSNEQTFDPITLTTTNGGASRRRGVELGGRLDLGGWTQLSTQWTFVDAKYRRLITEDGDTLSGANVDNTAEFVGVADVTLGPPGGWWQAAALANIVGPYTPFNHHHGGPRPSYALLHLSGQVDVGPVKLGLGVRNLFDRRYAELQAGHFVVPGQPRTLTATARSTF